MNKTFKKVLSAVLVVVMLLSATFALSSCGEKLEGRYSYNTYTTALGTNWNPHTWETNADDSMLSYLSSPFITMEAKDTTLGVYQWVYEMATSIEDVTADHQADLTTYNVTLPSGVTDAADVTAGYVFEIKLNPDAKWQNGEKITADDYIYSMKQLLDSKMRNYRANLYVAGESALAGAQAYYDSEAPIYAPIVPAYDDEPDYSYDVDAAIAAGNLYINVTTENMTLYPMSLTALNENYLGSSEVAAVFTNLANEANSYGYTLVTEENKDAIYGALADLFVIFSITDPAEAAEVAKEVFFYNTGEFGAKVEYDEVGCYKVDDYTIRYVCQYQIDYYYFLTSCTSTWLVYEELYEAGKDTTGELVTTNYGTSPATSMSYGVYKFKDFQADKQVVFVQNENWYGWERDAEGKLVKDEEGNLISYTDYHKNIDGEDFKVDDEVLRQHTITRVVINVMDEATAKQAFLKGELTEWAPTATDLVDFAASDRLYKVDETYTMSFFFNTSVAALQDMDANEGNQNSVVLSNTNFRKAFSLAIDRASYVTATEGYKPAFALLNNLYYYDFYNDPNSSYRNTTQAKEAILNLYGVEYGEGTDYETIDEAVASVTGYNLDEAKALMAQACDELVEADLYTEGEAITIKIGWAKGALTSADNQQITLMNQFINAAVAGSGFGTITLEGVGNIEDRYAAVPGGKFAIGYGAWGGAALYPFRNFQVYMDPDEYKINEAACWNPKAETLTLNIGGEDVTMTWQAWSTCMIGGGQFANADFDTKLDILARLETLYLEKYYRIPLAATTICSMLSYQMDYYTQEYNFAYGFGGSRLMSFHYDDAEWKAFVAEQGGTLSYE